MQNDRLQISTQGSFNRGNKFWIDLELCDKGASQRRMNSRRIIESSEHGLRTLSEAFTLFVELAQNFETRFLFCQGAFNCDETFFGVVQELLLLL